MIQFLSYSHISGIRRGSRPKLQKSQMGSTFQLLNMYSGKLYIDCVWLCEKLTCLYCLIAYELKMHLIRPVGLRYSKTTTATVSVYSHLMLTGTLCYEQLYSHK